MSGVGRLACWIHNPSTVLGIPIIRFSDLLETMRRTPDAPLRVLTPVPPE